MPHILLSTQNYAKINKTLRPNSNNSNHPYQFTYCTISSSLLPGKFLENHLLLTICYLLSHYLLQSMARPSQCLLWPGQP